jgi:predicted anti-sigma-YlaC factor YlaD
MNCEQIDELLSDLLDGELAEGARAGVEAHLASCGNCASSYKKMRRTVRFVRANAEPDLAPGTPGGLYALFSRSHMDPTLGRNETDIIREGGFE